MSDQIKSSTCPTGSEPTQSGLYCKAGDVITSPEEYAGELVITCGSDQSSARGVPGFTIDGGEMKCIREGFAKKGISLPKEYFYFDSLSNIEGYTCLNTVNTATSISIVENGMDVVKDCVKDEAKAEAFKKFAKLHTPPDSHGTGDWAALFALFCVGAPIMGIVFQHLYQKLFGPKGPPPAPPTQPGGSAPKASPAPEPSSKPAQFSVPAEPLLFPDLGFTPAPGYLPENGYSDVHNPFPIMNPLPQSFVPNTSPAPATSPAMSSSPASSSSSSSSSSRSIGIRPPTETEAMGIGTILGIGVIGAILMYFCPSLMFQTSGANGVMMTPGTGGFLQGGDSYGGMGPMA